MDEKDGIEAIEQTRKQIIFQSEKKQSPSLNNRYADFEVDSIINRNPSEELKLIKQRIKNENEKIKEINSQLEQLSANNIINNSKSTNKRNVIKNYYNRNQNSDLLYPNIIVSSSQQITKRSRLFNIDLSPLDLIHQKMNNLRKIKIENIKASNNVESINKKLNEMKNGLTNERNKSNLRNVKAI